MSQAHTRAGHDPRAVEKLFTEAMDADTKGNHWHALELLEKCLEAGPGHEQASFHLARLFDRFSDDDRAIEIYERMAAGSTVHASVLVNLAVLLEDHNAFDRAAQCLEAVLKSNPNHTRARMFLKDVEASRTMFVKDVDKATTRRNLLLDRPISEFQLSVRCRNTLAKMSINTLGELLKVTESELMDSKNFGEGSLQEIKDLLQSKGLKLGQSVVGQAETPAGDDPTAGISPQILSKTVDDLNLKIRSRNALKKLQVVTVGDLLKKSERELMAIKNFGATSLQEIRDALIREGVTLRKS